jgi:hypothetical protein
MTASAASTTELTEAIRARSPRWKTCSKSPWMLAPLHRANPEITRTDPDERRIPWTLVGTGRPRLTRFPLTLPLPAERRRADRVLTAIGFRTITGGRGYVSGHMARLAIRHRGCDPRIADHRSGVVIQDQGDGSIPVQFSDGRLSKTSGLRSVVTSTDLAFAQTDDVVKTPAVAWIGGVVTASSRARSRNTIADR